MRHTFFDGPGRFAGVVVAAVLAGATPARAQSLIGVRSDDGTLHSISTVDASSTPLGVTCHPRLGDLLMSPDGFLYGIHSNVNPYLVRTDPNTGTSTIVGSLGLSYVYEGALAIDPGGNAYGFNALTSVPYMFRIDLTTGAASGLVPLSNGLFDINGAVFRSDGYIAAIDRVTNALVIIHPYTGVKSVVATLTPLLGEVGGLAVRNGVAYFTTGPASGTNPGSNELWRINLHTGVHSLVGSLGAIGSGGGISGIVGDEFGVGTPFCFGDGASTACPCGNASAPGDRVGCLHSLNRGGALRGTGVSSVSADTVVLRASGLTNSSALYFEGPWTLADGNGFVFGDGLLCVNGSITRLGTRPSTGGASQYPGPGDASVSVRGAITPGSTRHYQVWFRNAAVFCTSSTFNLTNALTILWAP